MNSLVSIIIPVYNVEIFLEKCVESAVAQTYKNTEIILVDDGAKDSSPEICDRLAEKHQNIRVIHQKNQGVSVARNNGISDAKGKYIFFLDADDSIPEDAIENLVISAEDTDADMTIGKYNKSENLPYGIFSGEDFLKMALCDIPVAYFTFRILFKSKLIKDIKFPEGYICSEDSYFVFLCGLKMPKVSVIDKVVYNYNTTNMNSATRTAFNKKRYDDICNLLDKKERIILEKYNHLEKDFYHLKIKIQMMLLANIMKIKDDSFSQEEKKALREFKRLKKYFRSEFYHDKRFYFILSNNLYYPYKFVFNQILKR